MSKKQTNPLESELALYKQAFIEATAAGTYESYEGWGGMRRRYLGPESSRKKFLLLARQKLGALE